MMLTQSKNPFILEIKLLCDKTTPLGVPVDPDVNMIMATSSFVGGALSKIFKKIKFKQVIKSLLGCV